MTEHDEKYRDDTRLEHMLQALRSLVEASQSISSSEALVANGQLTKAIMYDFIILGEAANNMSKEYCANHSVLPWSEVAGFRHRLVHDYAGVDFGILFDTLKNDVPKLLIIVEQLVAELPPPSAKPTNLSDFF